MMLNFFSRGSGGLRPPIVQLPAPAPFVLRTHSLCSSSVPEATYSYSAFPSTSFAARRPNHITTTGYGGARRGSRHTQGGGVLISLPGKEPPVEPTRGRAPHQKVKRRNSAMIFLPSPATRQTKRESIAATRRAQSGTCFLPEGPNESQAAEYAQRSLAVGTLPVAVGKRKP